MRAPGGGRHDNPAYDAQPFNRVLDQRTRNGKRSRCHTARNYSGAARSFVQGHPPCDAYASLPATRPRSGQADTRRSRPGEINDLLRSGDGGRRPKRSPRRAARRRR
ncbi:hypothetical protein SKAU_G00103490 [Synaphobranchus kaupii]|uniref:Uncharacterized protein n=1 Tax=Synaphobranchus kaupii TaxID=118154 RepID=A0A9Q1J7N0_SYNKA|nr:hypothetical protein SKAU_G00103490 [Synaphobranchus kaupii]